MHKHFHASVFTVFKIICSQCIKHGSSSESVVWVFQILPQYNFSGKDKCGRWDKKENKILPWLQWPENDCPITHVTLLWNLGGCHPGNFMTVAALWIQCWGYCILCWASPKLSSRRIHLWCRRHRFNPWVWKIPWRRKWQPTPVILPIKSHGQRNLAGCSPWGHKRAGHNWPNSWVCESHEMPGKAIENACLGLCRKIQMEDLC